MMEERSIKSTAAIGRLVGVIATRAALVRATRLRKPPDLFELRLDAFYRFLDDLESAIAKLRAPLILTARHPGDGGCNRLSPATRRELLLRFLDRAAFIDLELRSLGQMQPVLEQARRDKIGLIISCHHLDDTPPLHHLQRQLKTAVNSHADIFKVATRTDTCVQLDRLIAFFETNSGALPLAAMGIGKLGAQSRRRLAQLGSVLVYASLGEPTADGQPSLGKLRRLSRAYTT
jgi:3-dehydroquinate dehydratase-1